MNLLFDTDEREVKLPKRYQTLTTPIPDCSQPDAISEWAWEDLSEAEIVTLNAIYLAQPHAIDQLGSTSVMSRMATVFSARTGRPTSPHTLFRELMALRKDGLLPKRRGQK